MDGEARAARRARRTYGRRNVEEMRGQRFILELDADDGYRRFVALILDEDGVRRGHRRIHIATCEIDENAQKRRKHVNR